MRPKTRININVDAHLGPRGGQSHAMNSLLRPKMRININGDAHIGPQMCSKSCLKHGLAGVWSLKTRITINVDAHVGPRCGQNHALNWRLRPQTRININVDAHLGSQMCSKSYLNHVLAGFGGPEHASTQRLMRIVWPEAGKIMSWLAFATQNAHQHKC